MEEKRSPFQDLVSALAHKRRPLAEAAAVPCGTEIKYDNVSEFMGFCFRALKHTGGVVCRSWNG